MIISEVKEKNLEHLLTKYQSYQKLKISRHVFDTISKISGHV
jgi:hypothetical protein